MAGSPFVSRISWARESAPALTLSTAEPGFSRERARLAWTHSHVPGRICMIPRALALESTPLLKPLSCHAMAAASEPGAPWRGAIEPICVGLRGAGGGGRGGRARPRRRRCRGGHGRAGGELDDRAGEQRLLRVQAVHERHLGH